MLPQFAKKRMFKIEEASDGMRQILWGLFKKVVVADTCAAVVDAVFGGFAAFNASTLTLACFLFVIQIYADFSGYSDMAIGLARLFGFKLRKNFSYPLFAKSIPEFWQKWHI